jgi:hypothetical protein
MVPGTSSDFWRHHRFIRLGFVDHHRFAIEIRVGEQAGGALEVHDGEVELLVVLAQAGATADDLFELGHRVDVLVQHDELAGLGINAGGQQLGGGDDDRVRFVVVDEVGKLGLAFVVIAGDAHHVAAVAGSGRDELDQLLPHAFGVVLVIAKNDGLGHGVGGLEVFPDLARHKLGALFQHQSAVEILGVVLALLHHLAEFVDLAFFGGVAHGIDIGGDADHLVRREEAVFDALLERVGVNRVAKVGDVADFPGFLGCGREAQVCGTAEVFEHLAPG